jgi:hypothetical protein
MTIRLKQSTASQVIPLGYFVSSTDGNTEQTPTIANTDIKLWKKGATSLANKNSGGATQMTGGLYYTTLDATDTNTIGPLVIFCHPTGSLPVKVECEVLQANVFESLSAGTQYLEVTTQAASVSESGGVLTIKARDNTTTQYTKTGTFVASGSANVLTALG